MKIKFETENQCNCTTPCPYGFLSECGGEKLVGSFECYECRHCKEIDRENDIVECTYEDEQIEEWYNAAKTVFDAENRIQKKWLPMLESAKQFKPKERDKVIDNYLLAIALEIVKGKKQ